MLPQPGLSAPPAGFDAAFALNTMLPLAEAAYAVQTAGATPPMAGFQQTGLLEVSEIQRLALLGLPNVHAKLMNDLLRDSRIFGFVGKNPETKTAIIAFRGTQTPGEWAEDFDAVFEPYRFGTGGGAVHIGFQAVYEAIQPSLKASLAKAIDGCNRLLVTGHSLGGGLAAVAGPDIAKNLTPGLLPQLTTFAGPAAGLPDFARFFDLLIPSCYRVVNFFDIVPRVPLQIPLGLYKHVGVEVHINGGLADLKTAHSLELSYVPGLKKLIH